MKIEIIYCDHCGDIVENSNSGIEKCYQAFEKLPFNTNSANKGESGFICDYCFEELKLEMEE
jgi:hypothetical protein